MLTNLLFTLATAASGALAAPQWARQADNEGGVGPISPGKPAGGASNASTPPPEYVYKSDFDFQSLNLALNQELIELDLFHYGRARFTDEEFDAQGIDAEQRHLLEYMANQEVGHATVIGNMLQGQGAKMCKYRYDFETVQEFIQFSAVLTRWGESGVYGFLPALDSRPAAQLLLQSITVEARQQMIFRQMAGSFPMPVWFEAGISQSMAWTLLVPYLEECPEENPPVTWNIYPTMNVLNNPNLTAEGIPSAVSTNRTAFVTPDSTKLEIQYEAPGKGGFYNGSYQTVLGTNVTQTENLTCVFSAQLNATNVPFERTGENTGYCQMPAANIFDDPTQSVLNGTNFLMLTSEPIYVTPYNFSLLDDVMVAGPAVVVYG